MKSFKKLFQVALTAVLLAIFAAPVFADYLAMPADVVKAHETKKAAVKARDLGDFDIAAAKYQKAAAEDPQEAYKAIYLLNAVGCLLSAHLNHRGKYAWDATRGTANAQQAYVLLAQVDTFLTKAEADEATIGHPDGVYANDVIEDARAWYGKQLAWLQSQVPEAVPTATPVPVASK